jgi:uncharacterized Rmd1/YagE family protein
MNRLGVLVFPNHYTLYIFVVRCKVDLRPLKKEREQKRRNKYHVQNVWEKEQNCGEGKSELLLCYCVVVMWLWIEISGNNIILLLETRRKYSLNFVPR